MVPLRNGLFLIGPAERTADAIDLIESNYWEIALAFIRREVGPEYILGGPKALEVLLGDLSTPRVLIVYTKSTDKSLTVSDKHKIVFKTIESGGRTGGNLFPKLSKFAVRKSTFAGSSLKVLGPEAAILDALLVHAGGQRPDAYLARKFLDRYAAGLDREKLGKLVQMRYISSINRLREMTKTLGHDKLYRDCLSVIKEDGAGCFLTLKA